MVNRLTEDYFENQMSDKWRAWLVPDFTDACDRKVMHPVIILTDLQILVFFLDQECVLYLMLTYFVFHIAFAEIVRPKNFSGVLKFMDLGNQLAYIN